MQPRALSASDGIDCGLGLYENHASEVRFPNMYMCARFGSLVLSPVYCALNFACPDLHNRFLVLLPGRSAFTS